MLVLLNTLSLYLAKMEVAPNMQLKSLVASLILRTKQPVTWLAIATQAPERLGRLTGC